ncbi:MAG: BolA family transcriptional regulator [Sterolibacteriaceae bacterium]|uniref:BolA family transcriptional regulator n=1 Tax=Candidatus Methylophosphatis roskildensis TaxID=2899263 RepID=A0A9D7E8S0_9PROT|nr:BolA family transcriptional regulator [Candidatus Methylophosphatis roskildensis]MBK7237407.1 BolA family transcriptional regulator [Sterolibacteriaceae bacterium]
MNPVESKMRERLARLAPLDLLIEDQSAAHAGHAGAASGGGHYRMRIVSAAFSGVGTLARHRIVYDALGDMMKREIHALSIAATAPGEA